MKTTPQEYRPFILMVVIAIALVLFGAHQLKAQLTIEGEMRSIHQITAVVTYDDGTQEPVDIKGKRNKFSCRFENVNKAHRIDFYSGDTQRTIHVFTHQPDDVYFKWFIKFEFDFMTPFPYRETVVYWSPSQEFWVSGPGITQEDAARLADMKLWPIRIHPSNMGTRWE